MYRCLNCGHIFEDYLTIQTDCGPVNGCPWCGVDDMELVEQCPDCGAWHECGGLYGGLCLGCLRERIDYPTGLSYLLARDALKDFFAGIDPDGGKSAAAASRSELMLSYLIRETTDRSRSGNPFLTAIRDFILEDEICAKDFALWLDGEEGV